MLPRRGWRFPAGSPEQHWRNYAVRRHDPARAELDVDFALHDDPGVPAALAILESLPAGHRAVALLEVADDRERQPITTPADVEVRWLSRDGRPPGTTTLLPDAVRDLALPPGRGRAWGAGESRAMRRVRDHARRGIANEAVSVLGYWAVSRSSNGTSSDSA